MYKASEVRCVWG